LISFRRKPRTSTTIAEITQAFTFMCGNPAAAPPSSQSAFSRISLGRLQSVLFGDLQNWVKGIASGTADTTHFFNSNRTPAGFGYLEIMMTATNQAWPARRQVSDRRKKRISLPVDGLVKGTTDLDEHVQAPLPGPHAEAMGRREDNSSIAARSFYQEIRHGDTRMRKEANSPGTCTRRILQNLNFPL